MATRKPTEAQLRKIMHAGILAQNELREREDARQNKANKHLVGTCQKYRNSYGSGDKWWMYRKVLSVSGSWCNAFTFQTCSDGRVEIVNDKHSSIGDGSWIDITNVEFGTELQLLLMKVEEWASLNGSERT